MDIITDGIPIALTEDEVLERFKSKVDPNAETWKDSESLQIQMLADSFQELYKEKLAK